MSVVKTFLVESKQATSSSNSSSDFTVPLQSDLLDGKYELEEAYICNSSYNVNSTLGNTVYFNENSTNKTAVVPSGNYGASSLLAAIVSSLNTASGGYATYTGTQSSSTNLYTITSTENFSFTFGTNLNSSLANTMGFPNANTVSGTSATATYFPNLSYPLNFRICVSAQSSSMAREVKDSAGNWFTFIIPNTAAYGGYVDYSPRKGYAQQCQITRTQFLSVQVRDLNGNIMNLNGTNWWMKLKRVSE